MLIGADGIHSTARARLFGDEPPMFAGFAAYRGLIPIEGLPILSSATATEDGATPTLCLAVGSDDPAADFSAML